MPERLYWHEGIKKHWRSSGVSAINFEKIPHILLVFHSRNYGSVAGWVYQHRSKYRKVEIMKHARIDENQAILIKRVKIQNEKKPELNLLSMQSVGFQKTFIKFIENFVPQE